MSYTKRMYIVQAKAQLRTLRILADRLEETLAQLNAMPGQSLYGRNQTAAGAAMHIADAAEAATHNLRAASRRYTTED